MALSAGSVLVIEDNPDDVHFVGRLLHQFPVQLFSFASGQVALDYLFDLNQPLPSLVLLDLILPHMHGFDVLRAIRHHNRTKDLPVVILTSSMQDKDALKYYLIGITAFLVKPVQFDDLLPILTAVGIQQDGSGTRATAA